LLYEQSEERNNVISMFNSWVTGRGGRADDSTARDDTLVSSMVQVMHMPSA